ncbi:hypothetical protein BZL69_17840 [Escherichia coli]|nr:hypothetical protein BZL69_17840 [Escherichia coli]
MHSIKKLTMLLGFLALTCSIAFQASATEKFKVITTFTIIADMAKNVAGDAAEVSSITRPGAEIHDHRRYGQKRGWRCCRSLIHNQARCRNS